MEGSNLTARGPHRSLGGADGPTPSRMLALPQSLQGQDEEINRLANLLSELSGRLSPVLSSQPPKNDGKEAGLSPSYPVHVQHIYDNNRMISGISCAIEDLLVRLEV